MRRLAQKGPFIFNIFLNIFQKYIHFQGNFVKLVFFKADRSNKTDSLEVTVLRATQNIKNLEQEPNKDNLHPQ